MDTIQDILNLKVSNRRNTLKMFVGVIAVKMLGSTKNYENSYLSIREKKVLKKILILLKPSCWN